jgi:hypothetical protein
MKVDAGADVARLLIRATKCLVTQQGDIAPPPVLVSVGAAWAAEAAWPQAASHGARHSSIALARQVRTSVAALIWNSRWRRVCRVVRARVHGAHRRRGAEGSNPSPSSAESVSAVNSSAEGREPRGSRHSARARGRERGRAARKLAPLSSFL